MRCFSCFFLFENSLDRLSIFHLIFNFCWSEFCFGFSFCNSWGLLCKSTLLTFTSIFTVANRL
jgi:hypothetical protein